MLSPVLDVFRLRQYFNVVTRAREVVDGLREDAGLLQDARKALVTLPFESRPPVDRRPFPPLRPLALNSLGSQRLALVATGGS